MRRARTSLEETVSEESSFHDTLEQLYESTSWTVLEEYGESYEMDQFLKGLQSPAHQALIVIQHALKCIGSVDLALCHCRHFLKPAHQFLVRENDEVGAGISKELFQPCISYTVIPSNKDIPVGWRVLSISTDNTDNIDDDDNHAYSSKPLVSKIVSLADPSSLSEDQVQSQQLLEQLCQHIWYTLGTDLRNGAAAEAALDLSLVGVLPLHNNNNDIYSMLAHISAAELERKSGRSLRPASVLRVVEKLAASGLRNDNPYVVKAYQAAYNYLSSDAKNKRGTVSPETLEELRTNQLQLCSSRPLLWLWRRGHIFHKVSSEDMVKSLSLETMMSSRILDEMFGDPTLPLVVDVGCGLGVSLLGLAAGQTISVPDPEVQPQFQIDWRHCNFLGGELSSHAVRWANAMASRWGMSDRCHFLHVSTTTLLDYLLWEQTRRKSLRIELILLQFPTPYRLQAETSNEEVNDTNQDEYAGNSRLSLGPTDEAFMANPLILRRMVDLVRSADFVGNVNTGSTSQGLEGKSRTNHILLQSNCEDVALYIFDTLHSMDLEPVKSQSPRSESDGAGTKARTKTWLAQQQSLSDGNDSDVRRAVGDHWYAEPILPVSTETEAACHVQKTPIHRCLFRANPTN